DHVLDLENLSLGFGGDLLGEVAAGDGGRDLGHVAQLHREVAGHRVDVVGEVLPGAGDTGGACRGAQLPLRADLPGDAGDFRGERAELVDHRVDGVFQLEDLAAHVDGDLLGEVAVGHGRRDVGDVAHLAGQVAGHEVDVVGEVLPRPG